MEGRVTYGTEERLVGGSGMWIERKELVGCQVGGLISGVIGTRRVEGRVVQKCTGLIGGVP